MLGLLRENKYSDTAFVIEALYALHAFTPSIALVSVMLIESWYHFQLHQNFFRAAQIDLELNILSKTAR